MAAGKTWVNWVNTDFHLPYNPKLVKRAKEMRKNPTQAEKKLWNDYLKTVELRVLRQRPIDHFIVDFYCPQLKLVIEVDGDNHCTAAGQDRDTERTRVLAGYGLKVLRFSNDEVLHNFASVCQRIGNLIPPTPLEKGGLTL